MPLPIDRIGPYRVLRPLGRGGMGQVFAAVHDHIAREVALKVLAKESADDPRIVARFLQEGRALGQLGHPGIVRVHDCDKLEDGSAYIAMEMLPGDTLGAWMRKQNAPSPLDVALTLVRQIADAMVEVHESGIVHRDLKPDNIILVPTDTAPLGLQPKIVDFGIAKVPPPKDDEHGDTHVKTAAHDVLGTPTHMAPEQCSNAAEITDRADVYALGGILFELLSGRPVFEGTENVELLYQHVRAEPPHLRDLVPTIPPALSVFVASMLAKTPEQRPSMSRCRDMLARPWESETRECPFPGLQPFSESQAELFFGREAERRELLATLEDMRSGKGRCWLQIEGPSGAGKSSLVQAGLLPQLGAWTVAVLRPSDDPETLVELLKRHDDADTPTLLVIEQFEEFFTLAGAHLHTFDSLLAKAMTNAASPLRLLTTLRSDYVHRLEQTPELARLLNGKASRYYLRPMGEEALSEVVRGMAALAGLRLADGLAARMVRDATGTDSRLPLLGHTLRSLWLARSGPTLTHEHYEKIGGVTGALAQQAALLLDGLGEEGRDRAKWLVLDLVQVGRGAPDTRRPRTRGEVLAAAGGDSKAEDVLAKLSGMPTGGSTETSGTLRLLVFSGDSTDPARQRVDLVHETLLQQVPVVAGWIDAERVLLERHADLEVAAQAWEHAGYPVDGLPSGSLLDHYRGYTAEARSRERLMRMASDRARRFLESAEALERRRVRVRRAFVAALVVAVVAISLSAFVAWKERLRAEASLEQFIGTSDNIVSNADWQLGRLLYTTDVRREMLASIDKNLSALPDQDEPNIRSAVIWTKHRRSDLDRLNGTIAHSEEFIADARRQIDVGLKEDPSNEDLLLLHGLNLSKMGKLALAKGQPQEALVDFAASVAVLEALHGDDAVDHRRTLATSYAEQADAEIELDRIANALKLYDKSIALLEQNPNTDDGYDRALIASTLDVRAAATRKLGDPRGAAVYIDRAKSIQAPLAQAYPGNMLYQLYLGRILSTLAAVRLDEHDPTEALRLYTLAIDIGETAHRGDPTQKEYALLLCHSLTGAEGVASALGDAPHAEKLKTRRCALVRDFVAADPADDRFKRLLCP